MANITQQQLQQIISNAPQGTSQDEIVRELQNRGYSIDGITKEKQSGLRQAGEFVAKTTAPLAKTAALTFGGVNYAQKLQKPLEEQQGVLFKKLMEQLKDPNISEERKQILVERFNAIDPDIVNQVPELRETLNKTTNQILGEAALTALNIAAPSLGKAAKGLTLGGRLGTGTATGALYGGLGAIESGAETSKEVLQGAGTGAALGFGFTAAGEVLGALRKSLQKIPATQTSKAVGLTAKEIKQSREAQRALLRKGVQAESLPQEIYNEGWIKGTTEQVMNKAQQRIDQADKLISSTLKKFEDRTISKSQLLGSERVQNILNNELTDASTITAIEKIFNKLPEQMTVVEAQAAKRALYDKLGKAIMSPQSATPIKRAVMDLAFEVKDAIERAIPEAPIKTVNRQWSNAIRVFNHLDDKISASMSGKSGFYGAETLLNTAFQKTLGSTWFRTNVTGSGLEATNKILEAMSKFSNEEKVALLRILTSEVK